MIIDCGVYVDGHRTDMVAPLQQVLESAISSAGFVWVGIPEPSHAEFGEVAEALGLHPLAVEDSVRAHQRPKLERYGNSMFFVLKPARCVDTQEVVEVGQLMIFVGEHFVVTVRHGMTASLGDVRDYLEQDPERLRWGPTSVVHALADKVIDDDALVMRGLDVDIDQIEVEVFSGPKAAHAESLVGLDALLDSALHANVAQVGMRQNEDTRKISAWVAIIAMPTMIAGIYGMNFRHMPELEWKLGYPMALGAMVVACMVLYRNFKRRDWL